MDGEVYFLESYEVVSKEDNVQFYLYDKLMQCFLYKK